MVGNIAFFVGGISMHVVEISYKISPFAFAQLLDFGDTAKAVNVFTYGANAWAAGIVDAPLFVESEEIASERHLKAQSVEEFGIIYIFQEQMSETVGMAHHQHLRVLRRLGLYPELLLLGWLQHLK